MPGWKIVPKHSVPAFRTICPSRWSPRSFWPLCRVWQIPGQNTVPVVSPLNFSTDVRFTVEVVFYLLVQSRKFATLVCLGVLSLSQTFAASKPDQLDKPNLSGNWILDLEASTSVGPLIRQIGAGLLDRGYAASIKLKATLHQTEQVLTIAARGPGFALDQTLYLDGRT